MSIQETLKEKLEAAFTRYGFSDMQRKMAIVDLIHIGEIRLFEALSEKMTGDIRNAFHTLFTSEMSSSDFKKVYLFVHETFTFSLVRLTRESIYETLLFEYLECMNKA